MSTATMPVTPSKKVAAELAKVDMNKSTKDVKTVSKETEDEPLLTESARRFVLFPIRYHEVSFIIFYAILLPC